MVTGIIRQCRTQRPLSHDLPFGKNHSEPLVFKIFPLGREVKKKGFMKSILGILGVKNIPLRRSPWGVTGAGPSSQPFSLPV